MIGDFRFVAVPSDDQVVVELFWGQQGRMARVNVPHDVAVDILNNDLPDAEDLPVFSALGYAIVLAGRHQKRLLISGDRSVWQNKWGLLMDDQ